MLLDEWQEAPEVLGAVKRAVDTDSRRGRFILTGSVRAESDVATWPGTGRVVDIDMTTLFVREHLGDPDARAFLDRIADDDLDLPNWIEGFDVRDYVDLALQGGFPKPALSGSPEARRRWFAGYVRQLTTRDAEHAAPGRDPRLSGRLLMAPAHSTAGVVSEKILADASRIDGRTALAAALMRVDQDGLLRDCDLLGRMIDTFVAAQLRAELSVAESAPTMYHLRERDGREVDLIIEYGMGRIVGIEVKAGGAPTPNDGRHLAWLRDQLGDRFIRGLVLHTGPAFFQLGERIHAAPIASIWRY